MKYIILSPKLKQYKDKISDFYKAEPLIGNEYIPDYGVLTCESKKEKDIYMDKLRNLKGKIKSAEDYRKIRDKTEIIDVGQETG